MINVIIDDTFERDSNEPEAEKPSRKRKMPETLPRSTTKITRTRKTKK